ncbi:MAG: hypothetical protein U0136_00105 [Bdellovibrionota bacterium]
MKHLMLVAATAWLLSAPALVLADQSRRSPMSQLDFDKPPEAQPGVNKDQLKAILDDTGSELPPAKVAAPSDHSEKSAKTAAKADARTAKSDRTARASLAQPSEPKSSGNSPKIQNGVERFDWVKPEEGTSHYLTPLLRGPFVDLKDPTTVSTNLTWKKEGSTCADANTQEQLIRKAQALKELFNRFSGSDDFFERQCDQHCSKPEERAVLVGFAVRKVAEGEFKMNEMGGSCQYLIRSNLQPPKWQMLEGERGSCACLPQNSF